MKRFFAVLALASSTLAAAAQTTPEFTLTCQDNILSSNNHNNKRVCDTRDLTMTLSAGQPLTIDGGTNGGIAVHGWDGPTVRIRAKVQSWASTEAAAQAQATAVVLHTTGNTLRATAPGEEQRWAVSYEVFVPRQTALVLNTNNGGISVKDLQADIKFHALNGGVSLAGLGGQVTGETVNGGMHITLDGTRWEGQGLDVSTTNGGISWTLPRAYSAQLFASTGSGHIRTNLPNVNTNSRRQELSARLGEGGAPVKAVTSNGSVSVEQR
jgi:DUF4097 and DUF4098 domain-containing protein YvlB